MEENLDSSFDMSFYNLDALINNLDIFENQYIIESPIKITPKRAIYIVLDKLENKKKVLKFLVKMSVSNTQMKIYEILTHMDHPNICGIENIIDNGMFLVLVMKYIVGDTMCTYFNKSRTHNTYNKTLFDLVLTLNYLHSKNIIHGDIKPDNIIVTPDGAPIIIDFDLSRHENCNTLVTKIFGTRFFMAPEMLFRSRITSKIDVWSLGMTFYVCCLKYFIPELFAKNFSEGYDRESYTANNDIIIKKIPYTISQYYTELCKKYGKLFITSMQAMLIEDQTRRPTLESLIAIFHRSKKFNCIYSDTKFLDVLKFGTTYEENDVYKLNIPESVDPIQNDLDILYNESAEIGIIESDVSIENDNTCQIDSNCENIITNKYKNERIYRSHSA